MIVETRAKSILSAAKTPDPWFGHRYGLNLYRGCMHQCIYCDSRSECYGIDDFAAVQAKVNALELLRDELPRKRVKGTVGTGAMSDPYGPPERTFELTRGALELLARFGFGVHVMTKSNLVVRDIDALLEVGRRFAAVSLSFTTADDALARALEPGAASPSRRFEAIAALRARGVHVGVLLMPVLPFITDSEDSIRRLAVSCHAAGAQWIVPWPSVTLRDRQRAHFYAQLDRHFPGLRPRYEERFGDRYECPSPLAARIGQFLATFCAQRGMGTHVPRWEPEPKQMSLL